VRSNRLSNRKKADFDVIVATKVQRIVAAATAATISLHCMKAS